MKKNIIVIILAISFVFSFVANVLADDPVRSIHIDTASNASWSGKPASYNPHPKGVISKWGITFTGVKTLDDGAATAGSVRAYLYSREDGVATVQASLDQNQAQPDRCLEYLVTPVANRKYKVVARTYDSNVYTGGYRLFFDYLP